MAIRKAGPGAIGLRLLNFSRVRINHYVPQPQFTSRSALPPSWQNAAETPLVWRAPAQEAEPPPELTPFDMADELPTRFEDEPQEEAPIGADLLRILELHNNTAQDDGEQSDQPQPITAQPQHPLLAQTPVQQTRQAPPAPREVQRSLAQPGQKIEVVPPRRPNPNAAPPPVARAPEPRDPEPHFEYEPDTAVESFDVFEPTPEMSSPEQALSRAEQVDIPTLDINSARAAQTVQRQPEASSPQTVQRQAESMPERPTLNQPTAPEEGGTPQPPRRAIIVEVPTARPAYEEQAIERPEDFAQRMPMLDDDNTDTEQINYQRVDIPPVTDNLAEHASRLDAIQRDIENVQGRLDSIQRYVDKPLRRKPAEPTPDTPPAPESAQEYVLPEDWDEDEVVEAAAVAPERDEPEFDFDSFYSPVDAAEPPAAQAMPDVQAMVQRAEQPDHTPHVERLEPSFEPADDPMPTARILKTSIPVLPDDDVDFNDTLPLVPITPPDMATSLSMPSVSDMRVFEPNVWTKRDDTLSDAPARNEFDQPSNNTWATEPASPNDDQGAIEDYLSSQDAPEMDDEAAGDPPSPEADLLRLLNLPADTPVAGLNDRPKSIISRKPSSVIYPATNGNGNGNGHYGGNGNGHHNGNGSNHHDYDAEPYQAIPLDEALFTDMLPMNEVQRAPIAPIDTGAADVGGTQAGADGKEMAANQQGADVDKLARDVFRLLRTRLRIEQERRTDK